MPRFDVTKKYVEIKIDGKVVAVPDIKECTPLEYVQKKQEAEKNLDNLLKWLLVKIDKLEKEVKVLKGED